MTAFIQKRYIDRGDRRGAGVFLSVVGVLLNLLLFGVKLTAGILSGSVAITADGCNNLTDSFSCLFALLGFVLGGKKPNKRYPMGYGRLEYLSGLLIAGVILFIGGRMLLSSVGKLLYPEPVENSAPVVLILLFSILIKGIMYGYNKRIGKIICSSAMRAAALDSLSDCFATLAILVSVGIEQLTGFYADGYTGILVALCILYAGITSVRENIQPLLGKGIDDATLYAVREIFAAHTEIRSADDFLIHDYGPERKLLTFSVETENPTAIIPLLQSELAANLGVRTVICPVIPRERKSDGNKNKAAHDCQQYQQTKETQECEGIEHQTR